MHGFLGLFASVVMRCWHPVETAFGELGPVIVTINDLSNIPCIMTLTNTDVMQFMQYDCLNIKNFITVSESNEADSIEIGLQWQILVERGVSRLCVLNMQVYRQAHLFNCACFNCEKKRGRNQVKP